jgi:hypothetical protein
LARRSNPLDQAQCNFVLLCLAQQRIPFVAGGKPFGLLAKSFDLIAEAINVRGFVQDRILRFSCHPHGTGSSPEGFEPLRDYPPTRLTFSRGARRRRRQAAVRAPLTTLRPLVDAPQKALKDPPLVNRLAELSVAPVEQERAALASLKACAINQWSSNMALPNRSGIVQSPGISCIWHSPGNAPFNRTSLSLNMAASSLPSADAATAQLKMR